MWDTQFSYAAIFECNALYKIAFRSPGIPSDNFDGNQRKKFINNNDNNPFIHILIYSLMSVYLQFYLENEENKKK